MQHDLLPLFSVPFFRANIGKIDFSWDKKQLPDNSNKSIQSVEQQLLNKQKNNLLNLELQKCIDYYAYNILKIPKNVFFKCVNSWVTVHRKNDSTSIHAHGNSIFSLIYYYSVDDLCGKINFTCPFNTWTTGTFEVTPIENNILNLRSVSFKPIIGDVLIFPSHLPHSVDPSQSDNLRISVVANYFPIGDYGPLTGQISLR